MKKSVSDSLVIYRKQLGDVLLLQPALTFLASRGSVALATRSGFADMLALMPGGIALAASHFPRAGKVYCLETRRGAMLYAASAFGAWRKLLSTRDKIPWWHSWVFDETEILPGGQQYRAALFFAMLGGAPEDFAPPRLELPPSAWSPGNLPERYGVIHPSAAWQRKTWSAEGWIEALRPLDAGVQWLVTSGSSLWEMELASRIAHGLGKRATNLAGQTTLREFLALLAGARLTLCVDGSASHLSAAFGRPTLTLFGPTNPSHWHWPTMRTPRLWAADFVNEHKPPVDAIPVSDVRQCVENLLELPDA